MAELSVQIGADIKDLQKKLKAAEADLKKLAIEAEKSGKTIEQVLKTPKGEGLKKGITEATDAMLDLEVKTGGAAPKVAEIATKLGDVGKKGSVATQALKGVSQAFIGPLGIAAAVSAVIGLIVTYRHEILNWIQGNDALAASQREVNKALNEFYGDQVTKLNSYVSILEDVNTTEKQRKEITEELIKIVPSLTDADFKYGNNLDLVKAKIGKYVLAQASRVEADTLVQENSEKLGKLARIEAIKNIDDQQKRIEAFRKFLNEEGKETQNFEVQAGVTGGIRVDKTADQITDQFNKVADELENDLKPVQDRINELYGITFGGGAAKDQTELDKLVGKQKELKTSYEQLFLTLGANAKETKAAKVEYDNITATIKNLADTLKETKTAADGLTAKQRFQLKIDNELFKQDLEDAKDDLIDLGNDVRDIFSSSGAAAQEKLLGRGQSMLFGLREIFDDEQIEIELGFKGINENVDKVKELIKLAEKIDIKVDLENKSLKELDVIEDKLLKLNAIKRSLNKEGVNINIDITDIDAEKSLKELDRIQNSILEIQKMLNKVEGIDIDINLAALDLEPLKALEERLKSAITTADIFSNAISSSFGAMSSQLAQSLDTGSAALDAFVGSIINSLGQLLSELISATIKQIAVNQAAATSSAIAGGAAAGAATGPAAIFSTPAFIATLVGVVLAAFAGIAAFEKGGIVGGSSPHGDKLLARVNSGELILNKQQQKVLFERIETGDTLNSKVNTKNINNVFNNIPKFASGGFSGDNQLAFLNRNELILKPQEQIALYNVLKGNEMGSITNNPTKDLLTDGIVGEVILRGTTQVIQLKRAEKKMSRYYNS